jgi:hypothetical protein
MAITAYTPAVNRLHSVDENHYAVHAEHKVQLDALLASASITDGITEPTAVPGQAIIYVNAIGGDLECMFGDGFKATVSIDT